MQRPITTIVLGTRLSCAHFLFGLRLCPPALTRCAGNILNGLAARGGSVMDVVTAQCLVYVYIAAGAGCAGFCQNWALGMLSERLSHRTRRAYLAALLHAEASFYDASDSGDLLSRLASDVPQFSAAVGPKFGMLLQTGATFISGLVIGLVRGWRLALVLLGFVPLLAAVGGVAGRWMASAAAREAAAYAAAGAVASEAFGAVRTVAAFTAEAATLARYGSALQETLRTGIRQKMVLGVTSGTMQLIAFSTYAVVLYYGTVLIRQGVMTGGAKQSISEAACSH